MSDFEWNEDTIAQLRALWPENISTAAIGLRLGTSKNSIVGKAHRIGLPARPSPIRERTGDVPRRIQRALRKTLPPLRIEPTKPAPWQPPPPPAPAIFRAPEAGKVMPCCWPIGEPRTRSFRFCDVDSLPARPYCVEHSSLAYVRVRDRREERHTA